MTISLNPVHQGGEGRRLASGSLLIGRDPRAQIRIADPTASGRHCVISGEGGEWHIQDFSRNGTFLNDRKLEARERLQAGDRVRIADCEWRVDIDAARDAGDATFVRAPTPGDPMERTRTQASPSRESSSGHTQHLHLALEILAELARTRRQARADLAGTQGQVSERSSLAEAKPGQALAFLESLSNADGDAALGALRAQLLAHDAALLAAMQTALHDVLQHFSPDEIQRGGKSDAQAWQAYREAFEDPDLGFVEVFARSFEQKYRDLAG